MVKQKNVVLWEFLSLITCGICGIIWFVQMTDDVAKVSGNEELSGGKYFLLTIVTCGIFGYIWAYKVGKALEVAAQKANKEAKDNSTLYLVLQICGLAIINYVLIQNELNDKYGIPEQTA